MCRDDAILRIGDVVKGGVKSWHWAEQNRAAGRECFEQAGENGGYILAPSDHFFEADIELLQAFVDEATRCIY